MRKSKEKGNYIEQLMMHKHYKVQLSKDPDLDPSGDFFTANTSGSDTMDSAL